MVHVFVFLIEPFLQYDDHLRPFMSQYVNLRFYTTLENYCWKLHFLIMIYKAAQKQLGNYCHNIEWGPGNQEYQAYNFVGYNFQYYVKIEERACDSLSEKPHCAPLSSDKILDMLLLSTFSLWSSAAWFKLFSWLTSWWTNTTEAWIHDCCTPKIIRPQAKSLYSTLFFFFAWTSLY